MRRTDHSDPGLVVAPLSGRWQVEAGRTLLVAVAAAAIAFFVWQWLLAPPASASNPGAPLAATPALVYSSEDTPGEIDLGESFELEILVAEYSGQGDRGGISVSFPGLTNTGGNSSSYDSAQGKVETISYTNGVSMVIYHDQGDQIYKGTDSGTSAADYLLVESDDGDWPSRTGDDYVWRTLKLRVTPKETGEFKVYYRLWLCGDGYQECDRRPRPEHSDQEDQQRWAVNVITVDVTNPVTETGDFARDPDEDFDTLDDAGNDSPEGIWSDGTTMWVADYSDDKIYAYNLSTKARDSAKDFNTLDDAGNDNPRGIWSDDTTMWVADYSDDKIYAYSMATKARDSDKDFETPDDAGNEHPKGIWSDGTTMWVADYSDDKIYAYDMDSKGRVSSKDFNTLEDAENEGPAGIWSDGATMWVVDYRDEKIYAYNLNTKARVSSKDFDTLEEADNESPEGLWSDRTTVWVADSSDSKIYAYDAPEMAPAPAISNRAPSVSKVAPTSASVSLYVGNSQTFEASANDPDDNLTSWDWSIDGTSENNGRFGFWPFYNSPTGTVTKEFTHTFSSAGTYTVEATFTDKGGRSGSVTWTVEVINRAPVISSASPTSSHVLLTMGGSQTFAATVSDADNNLKSWDWSVDGTSEDSGNWDTPFSPTPTGPVTKSFSHTFSAVGGYRVRATFVDTDGDSDSQEWMVQVVQETGDYERDSDKDFNTLDAAGNGSPAGIWSDGTTMWVVDSSDDKIYAYNLSTKAGDSAKDFNTLVAAGNDSPRGIWSDGTTMWVVDDGDRKIYAYNLSTKAGDSAKDFNTLVAAGNGSPAGIWSDGTTMWVVDDGDRKIYAYNLSTKVGDSAKDFNTLDAAGNEGPEGIWSDGTTMWVVDYSDDKIYAYNLSTKAWDFGKDFNALYAAGNEGPEGIWSDGTTMWVTDYSDDKIYAYDGPGMAGPTQPEPTNSPPVISNATPSPSSTVTLTTGDSQTFQVSATDSDSNMTKWKWEVDKRFSLLHGHQEPAETFTATGSITKSFSHTFPDNGTYTVEVTFTDSEGESGTAEWKVEVEDPPNRAPSVSRVSPGTFGYVPTGDVTFTANANDPDDNLKRYEWFVDGESEDDGSWPLFLPTGTVPKSYTHTFSTAGEYTVRVTFTDDEGLSDSVSWTITAVDPITIQIDAAEYTVNEDDGEVDITVTLSASPPQSIWARLMTSDGTAESLEDFSSHYGLVAFSRDTTTLTQTFPVTIVDNSYVEPAESFTVKLELGILGLPSYLSLTRSEATVKVLDDDEATVGFEHDRLILSEANERFQARIEAESGDSFSCPVTVPFEVHMSHTAPDGTSSSGPSVPSSVTFPPCHGVRAYIVDIDDLSGTGSGLITGTTEAVFTLDRVTSADSDVASRVKIGEPSTLTVTIQDADEATVRWDLLYAFAREREQYDRLCVIIERHKRTSRPFTVHFSYTDPDGALSTGSTIPSSVRFNAGDTKQCVNIALGDVASDPASVTFTLDSVTSADSDVASRLTIGEWSRMVLEVVNRDRPKPTNSAPSITGFAPSITSLALDVGDQRTFEATASDPDDNLEKFEWFVNGRSRSSGALSLTGPATRRYTHTFSTVGRYTVRATFTDADGQSGSVSWDVTIRQVTPTIQVTQSISDTSVHINESVTVRLRMRRLSGSSGNGGITVSFPDLDQANSSGSPLSSYDSADGSVSTTSYTNGTSKVHYFASGYFPIHNQDGTTGTARYLIVESDDTDWPDTDQNSDYRTLELSFTPKKHGTYEIYYRFWLCGNQYDDCRRLPDSIREDPQQGWHVGVYTIAALRVDTETVGVTVASSPSGRTVTVDGTDYTAPHTATWQSGSSHRLDAPSPQNALGNKRYVFSSWSNGSSQSQTVAPVGDATYTANFTLQHFVSTRTEPGGIGINGAAWYDHGVTAKVGPAPDVEGYDFSHWRRNYQNIGSDPAGVSVAIDTAPFLVEAVYTVSSTVGPPSVSIVSPLVSTSLDPGDSQTFEVRATDPDNNISEWEWSVNGESQGGESLVPSGDISRTFTHTFSTAGIHSVKVTFADARGGSDSVFWTVPVDDPPPPSVSIVSPLEPVSLEPGDSQTFEVKATDPDNNISRWAWSVSGESGGGQPLLPTGSVSRQFSHTFSTVGTYTVEATFTDKKRMSDSVIWSVRVDYPAPANRPPAVYIVSPSSLWHGSAVVVMLEGEIRTFEALAEDPDDNLSGWEWRVDGQMEDCGGQVHLLLLCEQDVELSSPVARSFTYSFDMAGEHEVMVIFTDTEGATGSVSWAISVHDPADIDLPQPPQPSVVPDEPDDGKVAYISGVEANRATESDGDHAKISLWAITRPSCDYFTAGRPAEENPFMSVKEGLWVRLTVTNPSNFPRKSPIGMKVTYRNDARKIEWSREVKRLWPGCAGPDSSDVEMEPQTTRDVYFRVQGPWFYRGPGSPTDGVGRYEYNFRHQEPFKENPDLIVEVVSDEDEIQPPQLTGNVGSGTRVFWQFPPDGVEEKEWLRNYNGVVAIFNTICAVIPYCISPLVLAPDVSNIDLYHNRRQALLSTAEGGIEVVNTGQTTTDVRTEWRNRYTYAGICAPDSLGGATRACHRESVRMSFDRATAVLEIKAPGSGSCPMIETTGSDISIASCESKDGYSVTGAMWHVYGVGNKIVDNYRHVYTRDIRIRHQTDIEVAFNVHLELGPYRGKPYLDPDGGIIDYSAWRSDPDSVYWLVIGTDSDAVHVEGGGIQSVYADGLVIHECGQGNVKVDVVAPTSGDYYVGVFDDYLGEIGLDWEWDSTRSQTLALAAGEEATLSLAACPDSPLGIFEFRLYRQPTGSTGFSVVDKVKQSLSPYDHDNNVAVSRNEVIAAARDYFNRNITRAEAVAIIRLFFGS